MNPWITASVRDGADTHGAGRPSPAPLLPPTRVLVAWPWNEPPRSSGSSGDAAVGDKTQEPGHTIPTVLLASQLTGQLLDRQLPIERGLYRSCRVLMDGPSLVSGEMISQADELSAPTRGSTVTLSVDFTITIRRGSPSRVTHITNTRCFGSDARTTPIVAGATVAADDHTHPREYSERTTPSPTSTTMPTEPPHSGTSNGTNYG